MAAPRDKTRQIAAREREVSAGYLARMAEIFSSWKKPAPEAFRGWLIYASSYLFCTKNVRWMIDPVRLSHGIPTAPEFDFARYLMGLDFVLLTHEHSDHLDLELIDQIKQIAQTWVIPEYLHPWIEELPDFPWERVVVPASLTPFTIKGIKITTFDGLHMEKVLTADEIYPAGVFRGPPSAGYLLEFDGRRWLFPGDIRTYNRSHLPDFGPVDLLFAHLWLGRGQALDEAPPLLEAFCQFQQDLMPRKIILAHLEEFERPVEEYWDLGHAGLVEDWFRQNAPEIVVVPGRIGDLLSL